MSSEDACYFQLPLHQSLSRRKLVQPISRALVNLRAHCGNSGDQNRGGSGSTVSRTVSTCVFDTRCIYARRDERETLVRRNIQPCLDRDASNRVPSNFEQPSFNN